MYTSHFVMFLLEPISPLALAVFTNLFAVCILYHSSSVSLRSLVSTLLLELVSFTWKSAWRIWRRTTPVSLWRWDRWPWFVYVHLSSDVALHVYFHLSCYVCVCMIFCPLLKPCIPVTRIPRGGNCSLYSSFSPALEIRPCCVIPWDRLWGIRPHVPV